MNIILRRMISSDIEDYVRWFTVETEWADKWDAPWESNGEVPDEEVERKNWTEYYQKVQEIPEDKLARLELECDGKHIGWVGSYYDLDYVENPKQIIAIGADIPELLERGKGVGTKALAQFMDILRERGHEHFFIQTWSGNERMIHVMEKLGFQEYYREGGLREVEGKHYDAVTYFK